MVNSAFTPEPTSTGIRFGNRVIGYSVAVRQLDNGHYDKQIPDGMELLACIMEAVESGWFVPSEEKLLILWRWLVVAVFITEQLQKNGTVDVPNNDGGVDTAVIYSSNSGSISVYPGPERFALASYLEGGAIEKYGTELGQQMALGMYRDMVEMDAENGLRLSIFGRDGFGLLHDSFIEQIQAEGMPSNPVIH
ncbi:MULTISPECIES: hypothetical protein [Enterobacter cloacae complex]|uniref:hypothetical protein n=1 Tax=Enterobacter cloacae complex TaxID=354276 RepID=UPI0012398C0B|nr:hypothetical protein [Enterobacter hormaechei]QLP19319.1 hypothetical protein HV033_17340 [Enterobacter hormaechei]VAL80445.1 Uncharacterised protein [Enterobacter hormaechei]